MKIFLPYLPLFSLIKYNFTYVKAFTCFNILLRFLHLSFYFQSIRLYSIFEKLMYFLPSLCRGRKTLGNIDIAKDTAFEYPLLERISSVYECRFVNVIKKL